MPKQTFFNLPEGKRQRFITCAVQEFAENEYRNASVSRIVRQAGIAKGSVYQYFDDKRDLYFYLLQLAAGEKKRFLAQVKPPDPDMNLFAFLPQVVRESARFELSHPGLARVAYRALFGDRPFGDQPFAEVKKAARETYAGLVRLGIAQGVIDPAIDPDLAVFILSTLINEFGRYLVEQEKVDPNALTGGQIEAQRLLIETRIDQLVSLIERAFAPASSAE